MPLFSWCKALIGFKNAEIVYLYSRLKIGGECGRTWRARFSLPLQEPEFEPIVQLPENVELVTGEEEEVVVYEARAKLMRFAENQWKERGVGQIKILLHKDSQQVRMRKTLMRREEHERADVMTQCAPS